MSSSLHIWRDFCGLDRRAGYREARKFMKNNTIRVALLGAGRIGQEHAKNLVSIPGVEVGIVCDPRLDAAKMLRPLVRAEKVTDQADEVLSSKDIDAIIICTPTDTH